MSTTELLNQIINNFGLQTRLYDQMAELAQAQLEVLQASASSAASEELNLILSQRKEIIQELTPLNEENKQLQQEVSARLEIERFTIKNLESHVLGEQFERLKEVVARVEQMLTIIEQTDRESELLMRRSVPGKSRTRPSANHQQAAQAYNQAKKQGKPE